MANPLPKSPRLSREDYVRILDLPSKEFRAAKAEMSVAERAEMGRIWQEESKEAFEDYNRWVAENGILLSEYRQF